MEGQCAVSVACCPNLFIADGSVMVTGGAVNPTATITALALRSAEHLADTARSMAAQV
ncbi:hypothetical protein MARA_00750 (plasmid) [Mycolicibacterium arabiense]|uniref:Glucose-methanol-choline oxidoreductase C-terminal domain-containing protein n=1 Tax=Mycolicibacterium arabiense TaxID=1286181 RepID=A0A7I7RS33_9MYCO|nr:hypothetical protein [Mycolicibacterium arabiense]BBY46645.1 hypothetical protein MARA_00750 [Mycolicibacterium arabiense]